MWRGLFARLHWAVLLLSVLTLQGCMSANGTLNFALGPFSNQQAGNPFSWNGFTQIQIGQCTSYLLSLGNLSAQTVISLSDVGTGAFYQDSGCTTPITSVTVAANSSSVTVFFRTSTADYETLRATIPSLGVATYTVTVSTAPLGPALATPSDQTLPSHAAVAGTAMTPYAFINSNTGNNTGMTYVCLYNRDFSNSFSGSCSSLSGASFTSGTFSWTPTLAQQGAYYFQVVGTNSVGSATVNFTVDVISGYVTTNLLFDYDGQFANGISPNLNSPMATTWRNINSSGPVYDGMLSGFPTTGIPGSDGWTGDGSVGNPFGLFFAGGQAMTVATNLSVTPTVFTAWINPNNIASTHTGGVIVSSNDDGTGLGMTIRQSALHAGTFELETISSYNYTQDIMNEGESNLLGYWRMNSTSLSDISGNNNIAAYYLGSTATSASTSTDSPITDDSTSGSVTVPYNASGPVLGNGATSFPETAPQTFSEEIWFKSTAGYASGGLLMGFGNHSNSPSTLIDRVMYMDTNGRIIAGIYNTTEVTITSSATYNDGLWHQSVITFTGNGSTGTFQLYVDGVAATSAATGPSVSLANNVSGVWRFGYDTLVGWPSRPPSDEFFGQLSEASAYSLVLTAADVKRHFDLGTRRCQGPVISSNNSWTFLAAVYDGATSSLYLNGNLACSTDFVTTAGISGGGSAITIGNQSWSGELADLKAFSSGSQAQTTAIMNATSPRF
jgi:hypothetical protein